MERWTVGVLERLTIAAASTTGGAVRNTSNLAALDTANILDATRHRPRPIHEDDDQELS